MALMEGGVEDGEEAATFDSTYVNVSCVVTSDTDGISSTAGEYNNSCTSDNLNPSRYALFFYNILMPQARCSAY